MIYSVGSREPFVLGPFIDATGALVTTGSGGDVIAAMKMRINGTTVSPLGACTNVGSDGCCAYTPNAADTGTVGELSITVSSLSTALTFLRRDQIQIAAGNPGGLLNDSAYSKLTLALGALDTLCLSIGNTHACYTGSADGGPYTTHFRTVTGSEILYGDRASFLRTPASLTTLNCDYGNLTVLDVTDCPALVNLNCSNNPFLTSLDISRNPLLASVDCSNNARLTGHLDLSTAPNLTTLHSYNTKILDLNLAGCNSVNVVRAYGNGFSQTDVDSIITTVQASVEAHPRCGVLTLGGQEPAPGPPPGQLWVALAGNGNSAINLSTTTVYEAYDSYWNTSDLCYDGQYIWLISNSTGKLTRIDPTIIGGDIHSYSVVGTIGDYKQLLFTLVGGIKYLWFCAKNMSYVNKIFRVKLTAGVPSADGEYSRPAGTVLAPIAWDGTQIWTSVYLGGSPNGVVICDTDGTGSAGPAIRASNTGVSWPTTDGTAWLEWDGANMWATTESRYVLKLRGTASGGHPKGELLAVYDLGPVSHPEKPNVGKGLYYDSSSKLMWIAGSYAAPDAHVFSINTETNEMNGYALDTLMASPEQVQTFNGDVYVTRDTTGGTGEKKVVKIDGTTHVATLFYTATGNVEGMTVVGSGSSCPQTATTYAETTNPNAPPSQTAYGYADWLTAHNWIVTTN